ncbi:MAG TPA: tRNA adenosine(34) deaminase TadA [Pyrinomonadaceae bacterium]|nr:tRNA adenosine(34) deaminase TadA [Pyrinomonadaceae bacterium]
MDEMEELFLQRAIDLAREAERRGEVPIGAVIVSAEGEIVGEASNETIERHDPTAHAEILAIRAAGQKIGNYRLTGATVYSTIEPCAMCAGALVNARVARLVYGAPDERFGAVRSKFELCDSGILNHRIEVVGGALEEECRKLMQDFFRSRRIKAENGVST